MNAGGGGIPAVSMYDQVGGTPFFYALVERFYAGVATDPVLRPLYPQDLTGAKRNLADFLIQYWGGPDDYSRRRGHPMLRARHLPFAIGRRERDAWMHHMTAAVHAADSSAAAAKELLEYFERAATHLVNAETPKGHLPIVPPPGDAWGRD